MCNALCDGARFVSVCFVCVRACARSVCFVCVLLCSVVYGYLCVRCVCVHGSMYVRLLFAACYAMLYGLPLTLVVLCSCALLKMCRLCV